MAFLKLPFFFFLFFKSVKVHAPPPTYLALSLMVCFSSAVTTCMQFLRLCQAAPCLWNIGPWCFLLFISPSMTWFISIHGLKRWKSETQLWNLTWPTQLLLIILRLLLPLKTGIWHVGPSLILGSWFYNSCAGWSNGFLSEKNFFLSSSVCFIYSFMHAPNFYGASNICRL